MNFGVIKSKKPCKTEFHGPNGSIHPPGRGYTGEAGFELSLHGNPLLVDAVLRVLQQAGCRLAKPGEFSLRAVLSGKLDPCKAQAVYDLIHARSTRAPKPRC
ncbi:MAG: hypothetical protein AAF471_04110 [Myxococcota bacterium]